MQLLYHLYYRKQVKLLNNRNVSTQNVVLDQRYKISQNLGNCLCDVKFNHTYYCPCIDWYYHELPLSLMIIVMAYSFIID